MDVLRLINASKAFSKGIFEYSMIVVVPFEPTLVVITRFTDVTALLTNAALGLSKNARHCAAPEIFLHQ